MPDRCPLNLDKPCPTVRTVGDLTELRERLHRAAATLEDRSRAAGSRGEADRLYGKAQGVRLAIDYLRSVDQGTPE